MGFGFISRVAAAIASIVGIAWLALWYFIPEPPSTITIGVGAKGGAFEYLGQRYQRRLAQQQVKLNIQLTKSSLNSIELLRDPNSGLDATFLLGGVTDSSDLPGVVSLGRIAHSPVWIFYRGSEMQRLSQLRGKRVAVGPSSGRVTTQIAAAFGVSADNTTFLTRDGAAAVQALRDGSADVAIISQGVGNPNVQALLRDPSIRLMDIAQADALTQLFPALNRIVMSQGVVDLENNIPPKDVNLVALTDVVVARASLHPQMIFLLAQTMKEEHSRGGIFQRPGEFPTQTDPEFPVADEAIDYYRNGPSFLQRYLPFWMINYAKRAVAILVAAIAIVIPVFTYAPRIYAWLVNLRLLRLYSRLRLINTRLKSGLTADQLGALQGQLESIDRAASVLPMRHSDTFFSLLMHIDMTRTRLAARLAELQPERQMA